MQSYSNIQTKNVSTHPNSERPVNFTTSEMLVNALAIAFPIVVIGEIVVYRKRQVKVMQQRIQRLNQLWQLDPSKQ